MSRGADAVFAALADPTRRGLLGTVAERGPLSATDLAGELPITRQAVAKHLAVLHDADLVISTRRGRETLYEAQPAPLEEVRSWVDGVGEAWDRRLGRLQRHLGDRGRPGASGGG